MFGFLQKVRIETRDSALMGALEAARLFHGEADDIERTETTVLYERETWIYTESTTAAPGVRDGAAEARAAMEHQASQGAPPDGPERGPKPKPPRSGGRSKGQGGDTVPDVPRNTRKTEAMFDARKDAP